MKPERILLPIDVNRCPLEVFDVVNGFADAPDVTIILLHVVNLNIAAPENGTYEEFAREAESSFHGIIDQHVSRQVPAIVRIRIGDPAEQILVEAAEQQVGLIILPNLASSNSHRLLTFWKRKHPPISRGLQTIIRKANCGVFIFHPEKYFDCRRAWLLPRNQLERSLIPF